MITCSQKGHMTRGEQSCSTIPVRKLEVQINILRPILLIV